jgi:hypothetical protein
MLPMRASHTLRNSVTATLHSSCTITCTIEGGSAERHAHERIRFTETQNDSSGEALAYRFEVSTAAHESTESAESTVGRPAG